jgi:transposase
MFDLKPKYLYEVYRFALSDYEKEKAQGTWGNRKVDSVDLETGEVTGERTVYIAAPENLGPFMCLDDKEINGKTFSILSNRWTGKIALMVDTSKSIELQKAVELFLSKEIHKIQEINCDMAPSYLNFIRNTFPWAKVVVDKFHVMKYVYASVQNIRLEIKSDILEKLPKGKRRETDQESLTDLELLKKARTPLSRSTTKWSEDQKEIMHNLFSKYPTLQKAYVLAQDFKQWYRKANEKKGMLQIERGVDQWIEDVEVAGIKQFNACSKMIQKHKVEIMNFFSNAQTNARAERLNGAIERFFSESFGTKDLDFALYRIKGYFS